jgi:hypothetical protein
MELNRDEAARFAAGGLEGLMTVEEFRASLAGDEPPAGLAAPGSALWWDAKGDWARAHGLVDELETREGMAVHAYLHRKEGADWNADYWYGRAGRGFYRETLEGEWEALVVGLGRAVLAELAGFAGLTESELLILRPCGRGWAPGTSSAFIIRVVQFTLSPVAARWQPIS